MFINFKIALAARRERQYDLAARVGITEGYLSLIIVGRKRATPELRARLAAALNVKESWLFSRRPHAVRAAVAPQPESGTCPLVGATA